MGKIKISKHKNVMAFDFYSNLLDKERLYNLCKLFNLQDIYMDIYTVDIRKKNFHEILVDSKICEKIFCAPNKQLQDVHIKIAINNLPAISNLLCEFVFEDLIIWDCYTSWEKYLEDKTAKKPFFTIKPIKVENDGIFYLNYNPREGQKVELICELAYDSQELTARVNDLLK